MAAKVLLVEDDRALREALADTLLLGGHAFRAVDCAEAALLAIAEEPFGLVVSDVNMPGMDGHQLLAQIRQRQPQLPVLLMTAYGAVERAVDAMRQGAADYLVKPFEPKALLTLVDRHALGRLSAAEQDGPVAVEPASVQLLELAKRVAQSDSTVLISGESGTGKEVLARYLHQQSPRASKPFIAINCAAIPDNMLEATLFGHEKGAFTGAIASAPGKFEMAEGGTILLDEISEMPLGLQAKLLRVLQDGEVRRVGARDAVKVDVRIISATNKDLEKAVESGGFREDLYYRLNVIFIDLPPLRQRPEDLRPLIEHFLHRFSTQFGKQVREVGPEALKALLACPWPGNVRQLQSVIERAVLFNDSGTLGLDDIGALLKAPPVPGSLGLELPREGLDFEALEKELIQQALARSRGVATRAAKLLRMNYKAFLYRMEKFDLKGHEE